MRIMADYHHGGLYNSLKLLAKRLEADIYRPIGTDWFDEGYWKIAEPYGNHPDTVKQYLSTEPHEEVPAYCNDGAKELFVTGQYIINDPAHDSVDFALTLEAFKQVKFDVLIVTYPYHLESWLKLQRHFQPQAKIVFQVGNNGWHQFFPQVKNILSSARHKDINLDKYNYTEYHQEFDTDIFKPSSLTISEHGPVTSFVNCLPDHGHYYTLKNRTCPPFSKWEAYGHGSPDGPITGIKSIANIMQSSRFGYHNKPGGDGYGHVLHSWFACGVPLIAIPMQYKDTLGEDLLDHTTSVLPLETVIKDMNRREFYPPLRERVITRWNNVVNFNDEFENRLKPFFERVLS